MLSDRVIEGAGMVFEEEKVTQISAYLLQKRGGRMSYLKLMKLLYLADRLAMQETGESLSGDDHYSMKHGPVLSHTYNLINGSQASDCWACWIKPEANYELSTNFPEASKECYTELSDYDIEVLDKVFAEHGDKNRWDLVEFTHEALPEWQNTGFSALPISPITQFMALGKTKEQAEQLNEAIIERKALRSYMVSLR